MLPEYILNLVLEVEGKYSNNPQDPGGETMYGITKATARAAGYDGPMKDLPLSLAKEIYERQYWSPKMEQFWHEAPATIAVIFDGAVNHGHKEIVRILQHTLNILGDYDLKPDGVWGEKTDQSLGKTLAVLGDKALATALIMRRYCYYRLILTWSVFGRGWENRLKKVAQCIRKLQ